MTARVPTPLLLSLAYSCLFVLAPSILTAQTVEPPFDTSYSITDLGNVPGLPPLYGGLVFLAGDPDTLLIGGLANDADGDLFSVGVTRNVSGHVTGFTGTAQFFAEAAFNDGGVAYGPDGVIFLARWPNNELGQVAPGSTVTDRVIDLAPFGIDGSSHAACGFVPPGFPGAGEFKIISYAVGNFYTVGLAPDGAGTFDVTGATLETVLPGAPAGLVYPPPGSAQFTDFDAVLVADHDDGSISAYELDASGNPEVATRREFISGLAGAVGAAIDPLTGDFLFSTFGGGDRVYVVQGFEAPVCDPLVLDLPATTTVCLADDTVLAVDVTGTGPYGYSWFKDGLPVVDDGRIVGSQMRQLTIGNASAADDGTYTCEVIDFCDDALLSPSTVLQTVDPAPPVTSDPADVMACVGQGAVFATTPSGQGPFTYQWRRAGVPLSDDAKFSGSATDTLSIASVVPGDEEDYDCIVTDVCGQDVTSASGHLTVEIVLPLNVTPPLDDVSCEGETVNFGVITTGNGPFTYSWRRNGVDLIDGGRVSGVKTPDLEIANLAVGDAGSFDCEVTDACGVVTVSAAASLTVEVVVAPSVSAPAAEEACEGQVAAFSVTANGTGALEYSWRKDGVPLTDGGAVSGATSADLIISPLSLGDAGTIDCVVTDFCNASVTSTAASLVVHPSEAPVVSAPVAGDICEGESAGFSVVATGNGALTHVWRKDGVPLANGGAVSGADGPTLSIDPATAAAAGSYDCLVTDVCGLSTTSSAAPLVVVVPEPLVLSIPEPAVTCAGSGVGVDVVPTGTGPFTYQWFREGMPLSDDGNVVGARTASLFVSAATNGHAGAHVCRVTDRCGNTVDSNAALVEVDELMDPTPLALGLRVQHSDGTPELSWAPVVGSRTYLVLRCDGAPENCTPVPNGIPLHATEVVPSYTDSMSESLMWYRVQAFNACHTVD